MQILKQMTMRRSVTGGTLAVLILSGAAPALGQQVQEIPGNLTKESVSQSTIDAIDLALPEGRNVDAEFLNPAYRPIFPISENAQIFATFLDEGAGYKNSLGYFALQQGVLAGLSKGDVDTDGSGVVSLSELNALPTVISGFVFPNSSKSGAGGSLETGDTVAIGDGRIFEPGTEVGFYLIQNGWKGNKVKSTSGGGDAQIFYSADFLNPEASSTATSATSSDENSSRHVAMLFLNSLKEQVIMGFEDLNRTSRYENDYGYSSDEDFNDAVFLVSSNPVTAIQDADFATAPSVVPVPSSLGLLAFALVSLMGVRHIRNSRFSTPQNLTDSD